MAFTAILGAIFYLACLFAITTVQMPLDLVDTLDHFNHSRSYRLFRHTLSQLENLLNFAADGLVQNQGRVDSIVEKLERADAGLPSPPSDNNEKVFTFTLSKHELEVIKSAVAVAKENEGRLSFYLHSVLMIALWSSFESYLQSIIGEVFRHNNSELASDKQVSVREVVLRGADIVDYLIDKEVDDFGHLSLKDMIKYTKSRLKFNFEAEEFTLITDLYFLRNVAAHNSGYIRASQRPLLPKGINIYNDQIEISITYLTSAFLGMVALVKRTDSYLLTRWNIAKSQDALFANTALISKLTTDE
jgi:hypothetical protein